MNVIVGDWMSEWSADGMNVIVLHRLRATQVENGTVFSYYEAYIYTTIRVCVERCETKERQEKNKECPLRRLLSAVHGMNGRKGHKQQTPKPTHIRATLHLASPDL